MFRWLRKRRAIRAYQRQLGPQLRARHGHKRHYTPDEVNGTIRDGRFSDEFHCFALSMYCDMMMFDAYHAAEGVACDYGAMRAECNVESFQGADFVDSGHFAVDAGAHDSSDSGGGFFSDFFSGDSGGGGSCDSGGGGDSGGGDCGGGSD